MRGARFEADDSVVQSAEKLLRSWHYVVVTHGKVTSLALAAYRRQILDLCADVAQHRAYQISLLDESIEIMIGPPDSKSPATDIANLVKKMNPGSWTIRHWSE